MNVVVARVAVNGRDPLQAVNAGLGLQASDCRPTFVPVLDQLIWYLTWSIQDFGGTPAKTRLVKLVYLVDLFHTRIYRQPATTARWRFYHFGPYAPELEKAIAHQVGTNLRQVSRFDYFGDSVFVYRALYEPPDGLLTEAVRRLADRVAHDWALADLNDLLSYVYFDTPPMRDVERGQAIDLSAHRDEVWPRSRNLPLAPSELDPALRRGLEDWRLRFEAQLPRQALDPPARYDEEYLRFVDRPDLSPGDKVLARGRLTISESLEAN